MDTRPVAGTDRRPWPRSERPASGARSGRSAGFVHGVPAATGVKAGINESACGRACHRQGRKAFGKLNAFSIRAAQEWDQFRQYLVRAILLQVMSSWKNFATDVSRVFSPNVNHVIQASHRRTLSPERQERTLDLVLLFLIDSVMIEIDGCPRAIVFAHPVNIRRIGLRTRVLLLNISRRPTGCCVGFRLQFILSAA